MFHFHIIIFKCCSDTTSRYFICQKLITALWSFWRETEEAGSSNSTAAQRRVGRYVLLARKLPAQEASLSQPLHNKNCYLQAFPLKLWEYNLMTWRIENVDLFGLLNTFALLQWMRIFAKQRLDSTTFSFAAFVSSAETMSAYRSPNRPKQVTH